MIPALVFTALLKGELNQMIFFFFLLLTLLFLQLLQTSFSLLFMKDKMNGYPIFLVASHIHFLPS